MKNVIIILICTFSASFLTAQNDFKVKSIDSKDIYFLSLPNSNYQTVGSVVLDESDLDSVITFEERFFVAFKKYNSTAFDGVITRDGRTMSFFKYKNSDDERNAKVINSFGKDIYFLSKPSKRYTVVSSKKITTIEKRSVLLLNSIKEWISENKESEGIIIENNKLKYIRYK